MIDVKIDMDEGFPLMECRGGKGTVWFSPGALAGFLSGEYQERGDGLRIYKAGAFGDDEFGQCVVEHEGKYNVLDEAYIEDLLHSAQTPEGTSGYVEATPEEFRAFAEKYVAEYM